MAEISYLLSHFSAMCDNICVKPTEGCEGYNLLGAFESALCRSNHFVFFQSGYFQIKEFDYNYFNQNKER